MIANMNEKGRQIRLLAAVVVLALVVCAFAVVVPSATNADVSTESAEIDAVYNSETGLTESRNYYVSACLTPTTINFASVNSGDIDLYIADGATVELTDIKAAVTVRVHAVSDYDPYYSQVKYYNELTIIAVSNATYSIDGRTVIEDYKGSNATGSIYGILVHSADKYIYYPYGADAGDITLVDNADYVYVQNGSVEISYGENTVKFENYVGNSKAKVSITSSAMAISSIDASSGSVVVTKGSVMTTALTTIAVLTAVGYEFTGTNYLYADVAAALSAASVVSVTSVTVYGSPSVTEPIMLTVGQSLKFDSRASVSDWTVQTTVGANTATVTVTVSANGENGATIRASNTDLFVTGDAVTGEATDGDGQKIQDGIVIGSNVTITNATMSTSDSNTFSITVVDVAYNGDLSADITVGNGSMVITADSSIRFNGGTISGTNGSSPSSSLVVLGSVQYAGTSSNRIITENLSVYTTSSGKVSAYVDSMDRETVFILTPQVISRDNINQIFNFAAAGAIQLGKASDNDYYIFYIRDDVSFSNTTIYIPSNVMLVVGDVAISATGNYSDFASAIPVYINGADGNTRGSLTLTNVTIYSHAADGTYAADGKDSIVVMDRNSLTVNRSYVFAVVNASTNASVTLNNNDSTYVNTTSEVIVGYGATLDLSGDVTKAVTVYGNLNITGSIMFSDDCKMNVYNGSTVTVSGSLIVQGEANFFDGSVTTVTGSLTLSNGTEGATLTVGINPYNLDDSNGADFTVSGTMTLNAPQSGYAARNELVINNPAAKYDSDSRSWDPRFLVTGNLTVNGQLSGEVHDQGIVNFNGRAVNATIVLYPDNTVSVTSVTDDLIVTDANTLSESFRSGSRDVSDGNSVTLSDVRGITVTVSQASVSNGSGTDYYTIMDISGTVTSVDDDFGLYSIVETRSATHGVGRNDTTTGYVQVSDTLTLGRSIQLSNIGTLNVFGTVNAITAATSTANKDSIIVNSSTSTINVAGWITALSPIESKTGINAIYFVTSDEIAEYHNYTGFAVGIENAPDAEDSKVYVYGSVTADTSMTMPSGITVEMDSGSTLTVSGDVDLVFAEGSVFAGSTCTVEVEGLLTIDSVSETLGFHESNIYADVVIDNSPGKTWTSLSRALEDAEAGDVITLNRKIVISTNTTIPEGVTVYTNIDVGADPETSAVITVTDRATLTVDGYLTMDIKSEGWIAFTNHGTMIVNGQFSANTWEDSIFDYIGENGHGADLIDVAGAFYGLYVSNYNTYYISSVELAGENTYKADVIDAIIVIKGSLASGDVTFAGADDEAQLNVVLVAVSYEEGDETVLDMSGSTMTLENALLFVDSNAFLTGSVAAGDAVFDVSAASQVLVNIPYSEDSVQTTIYGEIIGSVTLSSGEAVVDSVTHMCLEDTGRLYVQKDGSFTVASGATLTVAATATIYNAGTFEVAGAIVFRDGATATTSTEINVSGTMDVVSFRIETDNTFRISGTLTTTTGLTVNGTLILGEKPSDLGVATTGELVGLTTVASGGAILAYEGSDVSGAQINWNSATNASTASVTEYVINSYSYATIYMSGGSSVTIYDAMKKIDGVIDLLGWDTPTPSPTNNNSVDVWYDTEVYNSVTSNCVDKFRIGSYSVVYATFPASTVTGVVSKDAGIILTIDGLVVGFANGDVSQTLPYSLTVDTHVIAWSERTGYDYSGVTLTFNGVEIANGDTIEITPDMESFTIIASGAVPSIGGTTSVSSGNGLGLTDYLLIILVVLIAVMTIMVALRLMRS